MGNPLGDEDRLGDLVGVGLRGVRRVGPLPSHRLHHPDLHYRPSQGFEHSYSVRHCHILGHRGSGIPFGNHSCLLSGRKSYEKGA
jgi:hypothetical protein